MPFPPRRDDVIPPAMISVSQRYRNERAGDRLVIQGKSASSYEYNVAEALDYVGITYDFQHAIMGGRQRLGGAILDFLVDTLPMSTPLWVNGDYWHQGMQSERDRLIQIITENDFAGQWMPPVIFWQQDCDTFEAALESVQREFV